MLIPVPILVAGIIVWGLIAGGGVPNPISLLFVIVPVVVAFFGVKQIAPVAGFAVKALRDESIQEAEIADGFLVFREHTWLKKIERRLPVAKVSGFKVVSLSGCEDLTRFFPTAEVDDLGMLECHLANGQPIRAMEVYEIGFLLNLAQQISQEIGLDPEDVRLSEEIVSFTQPTVKLVPQPEKVLVD